ncbi:exosome complex component RRP43-like [Saccoglossus kowalevskii]|uniref:Ribosomal RNA-processing protein 43 n=1 Tax=Saccoglossus kowalevskii TaxID=10224 RepID=A0ABM0GMI0_SACKO|nr:PREDICTED: exosome complex component RRP43-like [Saccoglossus kowalevskii]
MAADFKTAQPVEYYRQFLKKDVRPDGRELGEIRSTIVNIGSISTAEGSALVKLGNTTVICGIKAELCTPTNDEPKKGFVVPNVDLPPLCSPRFRPGPPSEQAQVVSQFIADVLKDSKMVNHEDLCIAEGKIVWVLYCDMMCLDYDGNVIDACIISLLAALRNVALPSIEVDEETAKPKLTSSTSSTMTVQSLPVSTSFAIFDNSILIADPTNEEENLATGVVTVVTNECGELCALHKPGGSSLSESQIQECVKRSFSRGDEIRKLLDETFNSLDR